MSIFSCYVEVLPDDWIEPDEPTHETHAPKFAGLGTKRFSPYELKDWAKRKGAPIRYVDNVWLRVEVTADQLREFISNVYPLTEAERRDLLNRTDDTKRYVICAWEW